MASTSISQGFTRALPRLLFAMALSSLTQGCVNSTTLEYEPVTWNLDGKNELYISTYPAGFSRETASIPFLYKALRSPESVYFQVFVREAGKKAGANPNIESIQINSFSYAFPGQEPVQLISNYPDNFWMQGSPKYNPAGHSPVPYDDHWYLRLKIDLTVNGQNYSFVDTVHAISRERNFPLILHAFE